jgi:hypothetical protein
VAPGRLAPGGRKLPAGPDGGTAAGPDWAGRTPAVSVALSRQKLLLLLPAYRCRRSSLATIERCDSDALTDTQRGPNAVVLAQGHSGEDS